MQARYAAAGDPVLHAVQHPFIAVAHSGRFHFGRGAACVGFSYAYRGFVAAKHMFRRQFFLRVVAVGDDRADAAHVALDHDAPGDAAGRGQFLDNQNRVEIGQAGAAERFWHRLAHEALFGQAFDDGPGVLLSPVSFRRLRRCDIAGEVAGAALQIQLSVGKLEQWSRQAWRVVHVVGPSDNESVSGTISSFRTSRKRVLYSFCVSLSYVFTWESEAPPERSQS